MKRRNVILRYELANGLKSRWLYCVVFLLFVFTFGLSTLSEDPRKTLLALVNILSTIVPLVTIIFSTAYWYNSSSFTELLLSQPVSRTTVFWSRALAIIASLAACLVVGLYLPGLYLGLDFLGLTLLLASCGASIAIFYFFGTLIAIHVSDKMWGIGLGLGAWFYWVIVHDALTLLVLYWFREYPLDRVSAILCAANPIGLLRVSLLMHFDAPLLLGHSGALIRRWIESGSGYLFAGIFIVFWIGFPATLASRKFKRCDF